MPERLGLLVAVRHDSVVGSTAWASCWCACGQRTGVVAGALTTFLRGRQTLGVRRGETRPGGAGGRSWGAATASRAHLSPPHARVPQTAPDLRGLRGVAVEM